MAQATTPTDKSKWVITPSLDTTGSKITSSKITIPTAGKFIDRDIEIEAQETSIDAGEIKANAPTVTSGSASAAPTGFEASADATDYYVTVSTTAGSAKSNAGVQTAGYVVTSQTAQSSPATTVSVTGDGTKVYIPTADVTASVNSLTQPQVATTTSTTGIKTSTTDTGFSVTVTNAETNGSVKAKADGTGIGMISGSTTKTSEASTINPVTTIDAVDQLTKTINIQAAGTSKTDGTATATTSVSGMATTTTNTGYSVTATASTTAATASVTEGYTTGVTATTAAAEKTETKYIKAANFTNEGTSGVTYTDVSSSTPALASGDYLYINEGYTPARKISLAKLVPDDANITVDVQGKNSFLYKDYTAYDKDGKLVTGSMQDATLGASGTASATVTIGAPSYNSTSGKFDVSASGTISGTASASTTATGYAVQGTTTATGDISGSASGSTTLDKISVKATKGTDGKVTPVISNVTAAVDTKTQVTAAPTTETTGISKYYMAVNTAAISASTTVTPGVQSAGYGDTTNYTSAGNVTVTRGANASGTYYIPIATAGTAANTASASITLGTNVSSDVISTTKPTGTAGIDYYVLTANGSGSSKVTSAGYIETGNLTAASTTATYYMQKASHSNSASVTAKTDPSCTYGTSGTITSGYSNSGLLTTAPSSGPYVTISPTFSETAGSVKATATCTHGAGYCAGSDNSIDTSSATSIGITETKGTTSYIAVYTGDYTVG